MSLGFIFDSKSLQILIADQIQKSKRNSVICGTTHRDGGKRGIRTLEPREGLPVFKTGVFNRSTSFPLIVLLELAVGINGFFDFFTKLGLGRSQFTKVIQN